jgi:hypothetical protein
MRPMKLLVMGLLLAGATILSGCQWCWHECSCGYVSKYTCRCSTCSAPVDAGDAGN